MQHESGVTRLSAENPFGVCQVVLGVLERSGARYKYESSKRQSYSGLQFSRECLSRGWRDLSWAPHDGGQSDEVGFQVPVARFLEDRQRTFLSQALNRPPHSSRDSHGNKTLDTPPALSGRQQWVHQRPICRLWIHTGMTGMSKNPDYWSLSQLLWTP